MNKWHNKNLLLIPILTMFLISSVAKANVESQFPGFPCQEKAAAISNGAAAAIAMKDLGMVAMRYVQANAGYYGARYEFLSFMAVAAAILITDNKFLASIVSTLALVQVGNMYRHAGTCQACSNVLGEKVTQSLAQVAYEGIKDKATVINLLKSLSISVTSLLEYAPRSPAELP